MISKLPWKDAMGHKLQRTRLHRFLRWVQDLIYFKMLKGLWVAASVTKNFPKNLNVKYALKKSGKMTRYTQQWIKHPRKMTEFNSQWEFSKVS